MRAPRFDLHLAACVRGPSAQLRGNIAGNMLRLMLDQAFPATRSSSRFQKCILYPIKMQFQFDSRSC